MPASPLCAHDSTWACKGVEIDSHCHCAQTVGPNDPEQIHLALGAAGEMYVSWVTGTYVQSTTPPVTPTTNLQTQVGLGSMPSSCTCVSWERHGNGWRKLLHCMQVKYGVSPGSLTQLATGTVVYYTTNNTGTLPVQLSQAETAPCLV